MHILLYCTFYSLFFLIIFIFVFFTYIYILSCVGLHILHCPLSGPDLTYISLWIIFCMIEYVTNKKSLNHAVLWRGTTQNQDSHGIRLRGVNSGLGMAWVSSRTWYLVSIQYGLLQWLSGRTLRQQHKRLWVQFPGNTHTEKKSLNAYKCIGLNQSTCCYICAIEIGFSWRGKKLFFPYSIEIWRSTSEISKKNGVQYCKYFKVLYLKSG